MTRWPRARGARRSARGRPSLAETLVAVGAVLVMSTALVVTLFPSTLDAITPSSAPAGNGSPAAEAPYTPAPSSPSPSASGSGSPSPAPSPPPSAASSSASPTAPAITAPAMSFPSIEQLDQAMGKRGLTRVPGKAWEGAAFNVASFNVLGASHTRGKNRRPGYGSAESRLPAQLEMLAAKEITVAGLQEFQYPQVHQLRDLTGDAWGIFPGLELGNWRADNSIIWRNDQWQVVETRTVDVPYFHGNMIPMPYVLLEHRTSGRRVWFGNFHNPANVAGEARQHRARALQIEADLARELSADGTPVIMTGDMNDRREFACPFAAASGMVSPNGAAHEGGSCVVPERMDVDWIFGTRDLTFSAFESDRSSQDRKLTDHPLITATAALPGVEERPGCEPRISRDGVVWYCPKD
ncbi:MULTISPECIES: endonuclease/exonuclease/phosphatase family protein [unclassified Nocardioides]|uniref:endonuclease/exonuclease/phosphatase family protein n=1 Tax=unclassified Nocardioides TaxID=2615069 RepID=UPI00301564A7